MYKKVISIIALIVLATACLYVNPSMGFASTTLTVDVDDDNYTEQYASVINAYIYLEQSGYTSYDLSILDEDVSLIPNGDGSYFIGYGEKPTLMYAVVDLNGNGIPELLIGAIMGEADESSMSVVFITGIYALQDGKPVSLIQVGGWSQISFTSDTSDNNIINITRGTHIEYAEEEFYKIDEKEQLIMLDKLYTYGKYRDNESDDLIYSHTKFADGMEVSITIDEYHAIMQMYGSAGYLDNSGYFEPNAIYINTWRALAK